MEKNDSFLGTGWAFPPEFNKTLKRTEMSSGEQDVKESLEIILSTRLGERIMRPNFGCNLDEMVFSPMNLTEITYVKDLINTAILYFEPRIDLNRIDIDTTNEFKGELLIELDYTIRTTNSRRNLVYPFYTGEGTDI